MTRAVLRDDRPYADPGIDYERLAVARSAPRWIRALKQYGFLEESFHGADCYPSSSASRSSAAPVRR